MNKKQKINLARIISATVLLAVLLIVNPKQKILRFVLFMVPYIIVGYDCLFKAVKGIFRGKIFDENFLMALATVGAVGLGLYGSGDYTEAVAVMLFYQIGELFESVAVGKSRKNIAELMDIRPDTAKVIVDNTISEVDPEEVEIGTITVVSAGEKIALDGIVCEGECSLDTSCLTGESVPRSVKTGDEVLSGCICLDSTIKIKTTKEFGESTSTKILDLVENSASKKSKSEQFITKFSRIYTPVVCAIALLLAVFPPLLSYVFKFEAPWSLWIYRALSFLVVSCPCALVISVPLTFFAGLGSASHEGVLIKGSNYLEQLGSLSTVVFDKTGTLTKGVFDVTEIKANDCDEELLVRFASAAEKFSSHPIAVSLCKYATKKYDIDVEKLDVTNVKELSGKGVCATFEGEKIYVGNKKLMDFLKTTPNEYVGVGTVVYVATETKYMGYIVISDVVKESSKSAIELLKKSGVKKTVMLTGDNRKTAQYIANKTGIDEYYAELLPDEKVEHLENILSEKSKNSVGKVSANKVAFVGDGINDAPVLARADVGIAMGAMGSDAAIEAADVVIMDDDPSKLATGVRISRKCMQIVRENIIFALAVKFICLILVATGVANMWVAIFADVGVMILDVLNSIRALK